jgi:hypothetical protein
MRALVEPTFVKSFREWLDEQSLERKREIQAAERTYVNSRRAGVAEDPAERAFLESMEGYEDPPAGKVVGAFDPQSDSRITVAGRQIFSRS